MKYSISFVLLLTLFYFPSLVSGKNQPIQIISPDKKIELSVWTNDDGKIAYQIHREGTIVLES